MASTPDHATSFVKPSFKRFSITAGGPFGTHFHQAIHESMTLTALISSNIASSPTTTLANASNQDWEYIRGVIWNDDPDCFLFANSAETNHDYSTVGTVQWGAAFALGAAQWQVFNVARLKNITGRSHYGDLQFLHCMATQAGEAATETKRKIMLWLEVMYKLANAEDGITGDTKIGDTALREFFPAEASPNSDQTLGYLLSKNGSGAFEKTDVRRRALGSMFHVIQDSYALGHTRRTLLNPQDKISDTPLAFKKGAQDRWGAIETFHTYLGQDTSAHGHYDHSDEAIPDPTNLGDVAQWGALIGCATAIEKCRGLIELKKAGKRWDDGVRKYLDEEVFALSAKVMGADNRV